MLSGSSSKRLRSPSQYDKPVWHTLLIFDLFKSVFLVGGFAASEWLFASLRRYFEALNIYICRPDSHVYVLHDDACMTRSPRD